MYGSAAGKDIWDISLGVLKQHLRVLALVGTAHIILFVLCRTGDPSWHGGSRHVGHACDPNTTMIVAYSWLSEFIVFAMHKGAAVCLPDYDYRRSAAITARRGQQLVSSFRTSTPTHAPWWTHSAPC